MDNTMIRIIFDNPQQGGTQNAEGTAVAPTQQSEPNASDPVNTTASGALSKTAGVAVGAMVLKTAVNVGKTYLNYGLNTLGRTYGSQDMQDKVNFARRNVNMILNPFSIIPNIVQDGLANRDYEYQKKYDELELNIKRERAGLNFNRSRV